MELKINAKTIIINAYNLMIFFKWNNQIHLPFFGTVHYHFKGYEDQNLKLVSLQYRLNGLTWSDFKDVQTDLRL